MATPHAHRHETQSSKTGGGCGCGCGDEPVESICCGLDCLVQPRFFCGQLLSDVDLKALLRWTKDKARLARYRDGWGVACGLAVHCDPHNPSGVTVGPGYAVSCCGDDIVVCEDATIDLGGACGPETDPCVDPYAHRPEQASVKQAVEEGGKGAARIAGCPDDWCAVDLFIRYAEKPSDPQTALRRGACDQLGRCEYSRTKEAFELYWAKPTSDPIASTVSRWKKDYCRCLSLFDRFTQDRVDRRQRDPDGANEPAAIKSWLINWIDRYPLHQFCFLRDAICQDEDDDATFRDEATIVRLLLWIAQDCRNKLLSCACPVCDREAGVPLARLYLAPDASGSPGRRHVAFVDPHPPFRRPLGRDDCLPTLPDYRNLGGLIWRRYEDASDTLTRLGLRVIPEDAPLASVDDLVEVLACYPIVSHLSREVTVYTAEFCDKSRRVVAICDPADPDNRCERDKQSDPGASTGYPGTIRTAQQITKSTKKADR